MKKRTKKRYNTANDIRDDIERYLAKMKRFQEIAEGLEVRADLMMRTGDNMVENSAYCRKQADKARRSAARIQEVKLKRLKEKLSEWMTPPLPGVGITERSISS